MLDKLASSGRLSRPPAPDKKAPGLMRMDSTETNTKIAAEAKAAAAFGEEKKTGVYGDNQFWKLDDQYDLDELLAEMEDQ